MVKEPRREARVNVTDPIGGVKLERSSVTVSNC